MLVPANNVLPVSGPVDLPEAPEGPSAGAVVGAALRGAPAVAPFVEASRDDPVRLMFLEGEFAEGGRTPLPDDFLETLPAKYVPFMDRFTFVRSVEDAKALMSNLDDELADRATLEAAGLSGLAAEMAASLVSPTTILPIGAGMRAGSIGRAAVVGGGAGVVAAGIDEAILRSVQDARTAEETAFNLGGSVVLGALLGAGGRALLGKEQALPVMKRAADAIEGKDVALPPRLQMGESVGAAVADDLTPTADDFRMQSGVAQWFADKTPGALSPNLRYVQAENPEATQLGFELLENFFPVEGVDRLELTPAVETVIKQKGRAQQIKLDTALAEGFEAFQEELIKRDGGGKFWKRLHRQEFFNRVGRAMRRGDVDEQSEAVTAAAQRLRREVVDPAKDELIALKVLPPDVSPSTAASYFMRSWNVPFLQQNRNAFLDRATGYFTGEMRKIRQFEARRADQSARALDDQIAELDLAARRAASDIEDRLSSVGENGLTPEQIEEIVKALRQTPDGKRPESLLEFLADRGGIRDEGQELSSRDAQLWHRGKPGQKRLVREDGVELDEAARAAAEDGFIEARDIRLLLEAIDEELAGQRRVRFDQMAAQEAFDLFDDFTQEMEALGITRARDPARASVLRDRNKLRSLAKRILDKSQKRIERLRARRAAFADAGARAADEAGDDMQLRGYAEEAARDVFNTLTGQQYREDGNLFDVMVGGTDGAARRLGPLNERTFNVRDLDFEDFLDDNAFDVLSRYIRTTTSEAELIKKFGSADMKDAIDRVHKSYEPLMDAAEPKAAERLQAERETIIGLTKAMRDSLRGTYLAQVNANRWSRNIRLLMSFNFVSKLGGVLTSSLGDAARQVQIHGLEPFSAKGFGVLRRALPKLNPGVEEFLRREAQAAGIAEVVLSSAVHARADIDNVFTRQTPVEKWMAQVSAFGSRYSGINHWNDIGKRMASGMYMQRLKRMADEGFDSLSQTDRRYLQSLKIPRNRFDAIAAQMAEHGEDVNGLFDPRSHLWTDDDARQTFLAAMTADADSMVVTPGLGDRPLVAHHPLGAALLQFRNFWISAHQRLMIRGLAEDQARYLSGAVAMSAIGMFVFYLKAIEGNRPLPDDLGVWLAEGLDRGGSAPLLMELNNMQESMSGLGVYTGLSHLLGEGNSRQASRFAVRGGLIQKWGGPSIGTVTDAAIVLRDLFAADLTAGSVGAGRRLMPFGNHPGVKQLLNYAVVPAAKEAVE